jgi:hypothetical protein
MNQELIDQMNEDVPWEVKNLSRWGKDDGPWVLFVYLYKNFENNQPRVTNDVVMKDLGITKKKLDKIKFPLLATGVIDQKIQMYDTDGSDIDSILYSLARQDLSLGITRLGKRYLKGLFDIVYGKLGD